jgi:hypothetical protein
LPSGLNPAAKPSAQATSAPTPASIIAPKAVDDATRVRSNLPPSESRPESAKLEVDTDKTRLASPTQPLPTLLEATPGSPSEPAVPLSSRIVGIFRMLIFRNVAVGRKYAGLARDRAQQGLSAASSRISAQSGTLKKPIEEMNSGLARLQHLLETNDMAVVLFTLALIVACAVIAIVLWNVL